jgi:hypothetical protein
MSEFATHLELAIQVAIRRSMDNIVRAANADAALLEGAGLQNNQIRNVLNVADETHSLAVVTNFIRYQLGRSQTGRAWRQNGFGTRVIDQIETSQGIVARESKAALRRMRDQGYEVSPEMEGEVRYELMRHYLGYLSRAFVYGNSGLPDAWGKLRQAGRGA